MCEEIAQDHSSWKLCAFSGAFLACTYFCESDFGTPLILQADMLSEFAPNPPQSGHVTTALRVLFLHNRNSLQKILRNKGSAL